MGGKKNLCNGPNTRSQPSMEGLKIIQRLREECSPFEYDDSAYFGIA